MRAVWLVGFVVASFGVIAEAREQVMAEYKKVPAYTGRQCVEYVRRFLQIVYAYDLPKLGKGEAGSAKYVYDRVKRGVITGLVAYPNGGDVPPRQDDVLCFTHPREAGHVAIVEKVTPTHVHIVEQNWSKTGRAVLVLQRHGGRYVVARSLGVQSAYKIQGWCRLGRNVEVATNRTVLVLDRSGSIIRGGFHRDILLAFASYESRQQGQDQQMVVTFADDVLVMVSSQTGPLAPNEVREKGRTIEFKGGTHLARALEMVLAETITWPKVRVILVTDGRETHGDTASVIPRLQDRKVQVNVFGVGYTPNKRLLAPLAEQTGGRYLTDESLTIDAIVRIFLRR